MNEFSRKLISRKFFCGLQLFIYFTIFFVYTKQELGNNQVQKANSKPDPENKNCGINATHVNGTLMESVNVDYARNIYFTVKTTNKHYTERLFPLLLTWLQTVDKNQVN